MENDINREINIEQVEFGIDIDNIEYSIEINPRDTFAIELNEQGPQGATGPQGPQGPQGEQGPKGEDGNDGFSPIATVSKIGDTATISITDINGTTTTTITDGTDGINGQDGADGQAATITVGTVTTGLPTDPASVTNVGTSSAAIFDFTIPQGEKGDTGSAGPTGNGISNIAKTSTVGLIDTYTITYTNSNTDTFTVTNGKDGADGQNGAAATISVGTVTTGDAGTSASIVNSGTSSAAVFDFTIPKGDKGDTGDTGAQGVSVTGVTLQSTVGLQKTYRMGFSNGSYFDYIVTDGAAGATTWGGISGTLSNQTDLQNALNVKQNVIDSNNKLDYAYLSNTPTIPTVDQTYDSTSQNSQSGVAIAGAKFIQNETSNSASLKIKGNSVSTGSSYSYSTSVGSESSANYTGCTAIGAHANIFTSGTYSTAIGAEATVRSASNAIQLGYGTNTTSNSFSVGFGSSNNYQLLDGTTGYIPNDRLIGLLETIYPVGALYIGTTSTCPLASLFGTWTLVAKDKALWTGDGTNADTTIAAGLPNIKGSAEIGGVSGASWTLAGSGYTGAFSSSGVGTGSYANQTTSSANVGISIDASRYNSIYSDSVTTVQPPGYVVNVWKRTA